MGHVLFQAKVTLDGDAAADDFRRRAAAAFEAAQDAGGLTESPIVAVEPMAEGQTSMVFRLDLANGRRQVLKTVDAPAVLEAEAAFLRGWRALGVRTPEVYRFDVLDDGVPFLLMEWVPGESLRSVVESDRLPFGETTESLGRTLATMHQAKSLGFGTAGRQNLRVHGDRVSGACPTFRRQVVSEGLEEIYETGLTQGQLEESDLPLLEAAIDVVDEHARRIGASWCHNDFRSGNCIYLPSEVPPYAVLDPYPSASHPYLCLAYAFILEEMHAGFSTGDFLRGYEQIEPVDREVLTAATLIKAATMFTTFGRRRDSSYARNLLRLFRRTRGEYG